MVFASFFRCRECGAAMQVDPWRAARSRIRNGRPSKLRRRSCEDCGHVQYYEEFEVRRPRWVRSEKRGA
jgi:hypothetical protein